MAVKPHNQTYHCCEQQIQTPTAVSISQTDPAVAANPPKQTPLNLNPLAADHAEQTPFLLLLWRRGEGGNDDEGGGFGGVVVDSGSGGVDSGAGCGVMESGGAWCIRSDRSEGEEPFWSWLKNSPEKLFGGGRPTAVVVAGGRRRPAAGDV
uniref:Uncharacterized protein n=1 Tax=Tanacetum cinerariifolium TaxID=118510 RepID=A0A6L2LKC9_TANCI|nr:hypothetical protein [Tanacetum cinerariifolium]